MEIFVGNHALDPLKLAIGGGFGVGEHQLGIKNIEAFILHRAHIEVTHRHDVELIEVVFEAVALLIPGHRAFQGRHGVGGVRPIAGFHMDAQGHGAAAGGDEAVCYLLKLARHQGK